MNDRFKPLSSQTVPGKNVFIELLAKDASAANYHVTPETTRLDQENNPPAAKRNIATAAECGNSLRRYEPKRPRNLQAPSSRAEIDRAWQILSMKLPKPITPAAKVSQSQFSVEIYASTGSLLSGNLNS